MRDGRFGDSEIWRFGVCFGFRILDFGFLHPCRQFAERKITAGGRFHFIANRALEDDSSAGVVGDLHQPGGQHELVAQGDAGLGSWVLGLESRGIGRPVELAIQHASDVADNLGRWTTLSRARRNWRRLTDEFHPGRRFPAMGHQQARTQK